METFMNTPTQIATIYRRGVTVIEVLTSMIVAAIGVFGVMVLIPFSVQQAQIGLDNDAAAVVAENAYQDLQIYGFTQVADNGSLNLRGTRVNIHTTNIVTPENPNQALPTVFSAPFDIPPVIEGRSDLGVPEVATRSPPMPPRTSPVPSEGTNPLSLKSCSARI